MSSLGYSRESATPVSPFHAEPSARGREPVDGRGCAIEAQDVRVDSVPGLGPVDAGPWLAGIRCRSQRKGQALASELGTNHFDPILDKRKHTAKPGVLRKGRRAGTSQDRPILSKLSRDPTYQR